MKVRKHDHIGILGHVVVSINVLQRKDLAGVVLELDRALLGLLGASASIANHGLFVFVHGYFYRSLIGIRRYKRSRNPSMFAVVRVWAKEGSV